MPVRPLRPCPAPSCPKLTTGGPCVAHRRALERRRGSAATRGYDARHRAWRALILGRDPLCRGCGRAPSTHADHIIPRKPGAEDWSEANGQGLCGAPGPRGPLGGCHSYKTAMEQRDPSFGIRLRDAGAVIGEPAPRNWRYLSLFGGAG